MCDDCAHKISRDDSISEKLSTRVAFVALMISMENTTDRCILHASMDSAAHEEYIIDLNKELCYWLIDSFALGLYNDTVHVDRYNYI